MEQAMEDQLSSAKEGLMHCYCLNQFININFQVITLKFSDGVTYCSTWLENYSIANAFVYLVAGGIAILNIAVKTILRCNFSYVYTEI